MVLSFLHSPTLTSIRDHWENQGGAAIHGVTKNQTRLSDRTELTELNYSVLE